MIQPRISWQILHMVGDYKKKKKMVNMFIVVLHLKNIN